MRHFFTYHKIVLLIILFIGIFFRFYNTPDRYAFDYDPTRDVLIAIHGSETMQLPLIGPPSGLGQFTFGPWYYYQLIFFQKVFPLDYAPWIYIGFVSVVFIFIMYKIGESLENKTFGLLLASFAALSPSQTGPTAGLSNPNLVPLHAGLTILFLVLFFKKDRALWFMFLWGFILGVGINNHYQMVGLLVMPLLLVTFKKLRIFPFIIFLSGVLVSFIPLLWFNIIMNWHTITGIFGKNIYIPNRWLFYLRDFWPGFWSYVLGVSTLSGTILFFISLFVIGRLFLVKKLKIVYIWIFAIFAINFVLLRYVSINREYYYFLFLHPFIFIFFGLAVFHLFHYKFGRYLVPIVLIVIFVSMTKQDIQRLGSRQDHLEIRDQAQSIMKKYQNSKLVMYECGQEHEKHRIRGITFFLYKKNKIDKNGIKIGLIDDRCSMPDGATITDLVINKRRVVELGNILSKKLKAIGWKPVTPETVYNESLLWWEKRDSQ